MVISINCMVGLSDELVGSFVEVVVPTTIGRTMIHVHVFMFSLSLSLSLFSSSTDSELKLWSIDTGCCLRTFKGHVNDKNFVGLSVNNGYITCGKANFKWVITKN